MLDRGLVVSNLQSSAHTQLQTAPELPTNFSLRETGNTLRDLRLPGPPHANLGAPWEKGIVLVTG